MLLSCFTPCGLLKLSAEVPLAERIYDSLKGALGKDFDTSVGTRAEATIYAQAMGLAEADLLLQHAGLQMVPGYVCEMMADREREYGIVPGPNDSLAHRNDVFAARKLLPRGARREAVEDALRLILGANFVGYRTTTIGEMAKWPTHLGDTPQSFPPPQAPRKLIRLPGGISIHLGVPQTVAYTDVDPVGTALLVGDTVTVEPEILGRTEPVLVTAVHNGSFTGTFNNAHEINCFATTAPWPIWVSNLRAAVIIVKAAPALDPEVRRKVNEQMERMARGVSIWAVVQESDPGGAGPFTLDLSPLDATPFTVVILP